ncbi:TrmH family RNA methyltransferase [Lacrimispora algidixylanolytica]|uniref:rRNA methyltransferase n=1 Tax=Lacrimispora algidixylanolytica TaxID=94868 RepID=A0A419T210_9FIRM|nr:RNA methyltransferase [Lacrimispora algidixylanolytica]RKD31483.1 rRNA methyltransferase [Lacrimispora algidixylanolytica]
MITSSANAKVKNVMNLVKKAKVRKLSGLFVAEGLRIFREIPRDMIDSLFVSESFLKDESHRKLIEGLSCEVVSDEVFNAMSDTQTPQGILALVRQFSYKMEDLQTKGSPVFLMILESIQDPGNLGTIIRAGEGAGVTGIIMDDATADIYNPKVIRSTMGSICRVPFVYTNDLSGTLKNLKVQGVRLYAAHLDGRNNYEKEDYTVDTGFLIGNEGNGLTEETSALADALVKIPMMGKVESLNAAVAASILMFEAARQRR